MYMNTSTKPTQFNYQSVKGYLYAVMFQLGAWECLFFSIKDSAKSFFIFPRRAQTQAHRAYRQPGYAGRAQENLGYIEERPRGETWEPHGDGCMCCLLMVIQQRINSLA